MDNKIKQFFFDLIQTSANQKAQEVTCWLDQAYQELIEGWDSTEGESYAERYQVRPECQWMSEVAFTQHRFELKTLNFLNHFGRSFTQQTTSKYGFWSASFWK